ncbi:MarR family transcriptional regulator [Bradyrhizobium sp. 147]|uniref:MarR family winged helix-turn-helix transcriptional regulator n=1 Tax=unclassified Bradyrhizobium TaxID=2631580 RepID=UPI001FFC0E4C|nr:MULTISPECIES: MarR family transcriptional regulator [unclassified Bradyrhizobium]MCK1622354.1 MarR family transcriptional regulator [Bradyrhizobium sp. 160]MCK1681722.1 MarR family transcriptional regulator [Bradyrhizobium sp. 147]
MSHKTAVVTRSKTARAAPAGDVAVRVPAPGEGKRGEQGYLGYLLRQAHAAVRLKMERTLADLGVTSPQFAVLTMLNAYPGLSGADVARLTFLTPQTVGVIIRNLERDGAIAMTPHPVHGRIQQWTLTPRGATLLKACRQRVLELEKRLALGLDSKTETTIRRWLAGVATELQED